MPGINLKRMVRMSTIKLHFGWMFLPHHPLLLIYSPYPQSHALLWYVGGYSGDLARRPLFVALGRARALPSGPLWLLNGGQPVTWAWENLNGLPYFRQVPLPFVKRKITCNFGLSFILCPWHVQKMTDYLSVSHSVVCLSSLPFCHLPFRSHKLVTTAKARQLTSSLLRSCVSCPYTAAKVDAQHQ